MSAKVLVFIRHGESEGNVIVRKLKAQGGGDFPLTYQKTPDREIRLSHAGRIQCEAVAMFLKKTYAKVDSIYSSDHTRAKETCALVCAKAGYQTRVQVDPQLSERSWGRFHELSSLKRSEIYKGLKRDPLHWPMPDGESLLQARVRARLALERLSREHLNQVVVVFTHGEFMECVWAEILSMRSEEQREFTGNIKNGQVVEFKSEGGKFTCLRSSNPPLGRWGDWQDVKKKTLAPEELLAEVKLYPHLIEENEE